MLARKASREGTFENVCQLLRERILRHLLHHRPGVLCRDLHLHLHTGRQQPPRRQLSAHHLYISRRGLCISKETYTDIPAKETYISSKRDLYITNGKRASKRRITCILVKEAYISAKKRPVHEQKRPT